MWQHLNKSRYPGYKARFGNTFRAAKAHVLFCLRLAELQMSEGRYFIFEHPRDATSWQIKEMKVFIEGVGGIDKLTANGKVLEAVADQCVYGLQARGSDGEVGSVLKPTRFITNSVAVQAELSPRCK